MTYSLHDTHFHLDLFDHPKEILKQIENDKIYTIAVTNLPGVFSHTESIVQGSKYVRAGLGLHPELAYKHKDQVEDFLKLLNRTKYIGEVGLDNYNKAPLDYSTQKIVFERIIEGCKSAEKKILSIHSRRAEGDVISIIGPAFPGIIILHWYSGSLKEVERALSYGFYFSINYAMTQSESGKKIIDRIPVDRMLLETDGPFVKIGNQLSIPQYVAVTLKAISSLKKNKDLGFHLVKNFKRILSVSN